MTPEGKLTTDVMRCLKDLRKSGAPIWFAKLHGSPMQARGLPDLLIILYGKPIFIELKAPGESPTRLQAHQMSLIRRSGATTAVCDTLEQVKAALAGLQPPPNGSYA